MARKGYWLVLFKSHADFWDKVCAQVPQAWQAAVLALVLCSAHALGPVPILAIWAYRKEFALAFDSWRLSPPFVMACSVIYALAALALPLLGDGGTTSARSLRAIIAGYTCLVAALAMDFNQAHPVQPRAAVIPLSTGGTGPGRACPQRCTAAAAQGALAFCVVLYCLTHVWPMRIMFELPDVSDADAGSALLSNGTDIAAAAAPAVPAVLVGPVLKCLLHAWCVAIWALLETPAFTTHAPRLGRDGTVLLHCVALLVLTPWEVSLHAALHMVLVLSRGMGYLGLPEKQVALNISSRQHPQVGTRIAANFKRILASAKARAHAAWLSTSTCLTSIASHASTRGLFWFLVLNVACMGAEAVVGLASDSLALLSDAAHMASDNVSVLIGLAAAYYATLPGSDARLAAQSERMAGFINGVLLLISAAWIVVTAVFRLQYPRDVQGPYLLPVAVLGLCVNLVGMVLFHEHAGHGHSHGHSHSHSHSHGHGHSCSEGGSAHDENMHSVYLHVAADTLGSASVLVSYALASTFGWQWADPACSIVVALLIVASVAPAVRRTGSQLCSRRPAAVPSASATLPQAVLDDIMCVPGIDSAPVSTTANGTITVHLTLSSTCTSPGDVRAEVQRTLRLHGMLGANVVTSGAPGTKAA